MFIRPSTFIFLVTALTVSYCETKEEFGEQIARSWMSFWPSIKQFPATNPIEVRAANHMIDVLKNVTLVDDSSDGKNNQTLPDTGSQLPFNQFNPELDNVLPSVQTFTSPLDDGKDDNSKSSLSNRPTGSIMLNLAEMADCPKDCSKELNDALSLVLQEMSHIERYHRICGKFKEALQCVKQDERCGEDERGMFDGMTSGLKYMCVDQQLAFNATIKCIDDEAGAVQNECEQQCQTKNMLMNWMMRTTMQDTIQQGVNGIVGAATGGAPMPPLFMAKAGEQQWTDALSGIMPKSGVLPDFSSPKTQQSLDNFKQFANDICRIGDCTLDCIRSKFNTRCEGSAGTLLSEVFVRPIAAGQNKLSILRPVLGMFMPEQCSYMYDGSDLAKHRIDSNMDTELKRMYAGKLEKELNDRADQDLMLSNLVPLDKNGVPLPKSLVEMRASVESPLDGHNPRTLDEMIMQLYSRNETEIPSSAAFNETIEAEEVVTTTDTTVSLINDVQDENGAVLVADNTTTTNSTVDNVDEEFVASFLNSTEVDETEKSVVEANSVSILNANKTVGIENTEESVTEGSTWGEIGLKSAMFTEGSGSGEELGETITADLKTGEEGSGFSSGSLPMDDGGSGSGMKQSENSVLANDSDKEASGSGELMMREASISESSGSASGDFLTDMKDEDLLYNEENSGQMLENGDGSGSAEGSGSGSNWE